MVVTHSVVELSLYHLEHQYLNPVTVKDHRMTWSCCQDDVELTGDGDPMAWKFTCSKSAKGDVPHPSNNIHLLLQHDGKNIFFL